jgi:hypothetical protein
MEENRYSRGKIYKIVDNTNGNIYIGSTTEPTLARRLAKHRGNYISYLNGTSSYMSSYKIIENGDYDIVLVENCPCDTKDELHKRERHYIETLECVNMVIVGRTNKEYREQNKEKIKQYEEKNKIIRQKAYEKNKTEILDKRKKYYEENIEKIKERKKLQYEKNKIEINEKSKVKYHCECGSCLRIGDKAAHKKTKKHLKYLEENLVV